VTYSRGLLARNPPVDPVFLFAGGNVTGARQNPRYFRCRYEGKNEWASRFPIRDEVSGNAAVVTVVRPGNLSLRWKG
jgi:hypothetical protein